MPTEEFNNGFILYAGSMFGGKTAQAILNAQRAQIANRKVQAFKINWDNRYDDSFITANNEQLKYPAISVPNLGGLIKKLNKDTEIIIIDEIQFFDENIYDFILENKSQKRIIATGLQTDYRGNSFPLRSIKGKEFDSEKYSIGDLMGISTKIKQFWPICKYPINGEKYNCDSAYYNQRFNSDGTLSLYSEPTVVIGGTNRYLALCDKHFIRPLKNNTFRNYNGEILTQKQTKDYIFKKNVK